MKGIMRYQKAACLLGGLLFILPQIAMAATTANITVKATVVVRPPCIINDNKAITVEFGDVMTTRVDGSNYRMPVNYTLTCTSASSNAMTLQIIGTGAAFNSALLQTSNSALGIELQQDSTPVAINSLLKFTYPTKPALWAVPVQQSGTSLTAGEFTAAATMKLNYQ